MRVSPPPFLQDHGVVARHNKFGTFQVKIEQTETQTKTQTETEKTTVVEAPTAGQRAVGFRTLAIIGVAAACGLSAFEVLFHTHSLHPASLRHSSRHLAAHPTCTLRSTLRS